MSVAHVSILTPQQPRIHLNVVCTGVYRNQNPLSTRGYGASKRTKKNLRKCSIREQIDDFLRNLHVVDFSAISCSGYDGTFLLDDVVDVFVDCP